MKCKHPKCRHKNVSFDKHSPCVTLTPFKMQNITVTPESRCLFPENTQPTLLIGTDKSSVFPLL